MRTKGFLKGAGATILGIGMFLGFFIVAIFLIIVFLKGATYLSSTVEPILNKISVPLFLLCIFVFLPLTFFRKTRTTGLVSLFISSFAFGLLAWLLGFITTYYYLGLGWLIFGLFFAGIGVVPIGLIASFTHHRPDIGWSLIILLAITYGLRLYATYMDEHEQSHPHIEAHRSTNPWKLATVALMIVVLGLVGTAYWYNNNHYTASYDGNFLSSCESGGASVDACGCALGVLKANYTYAQAKAINVLGEVPQSLANAISSECAGD